MNKGMFIELWAGLRDLMHDNTTTNATNDAKRFINWTLADLALEYDWDFLRGDLQLTATAGSGVYDLSPIAQLTATAETLYVQTDATADDGETVTIFGKQIGASSTLTITNDDITVIGTATATGGSGFSHIDYIRKNTTSGTIIVTTSTGGTVATLSATDTYVSNDLDKINIITDNTQSLRVYPYDQATYERGNPNDSNLANISAYDLTHDMKLKLFNVDTSTALTVFYQRKPKYLVNDQDRSEFPYTFYSQIINAAYEGYGLRYKDEQDALFGKQRYKELLREIVSNYILGKDKPKARVMPSWYTRRI